MSEGIGRIQDHFHALIRKRARNLADGLELPLLPRDARAFNEQWFPVPGMYGGFAYSLHDEPEGPVLIVESWSRVEEGSGQRHRITLDGCGLQDKGFV